MPTDRYVLVPAKLTMQQRRAINERAGTGDPYADIYGAALASAPPVGEEERAKAVCRERCAFMGEPACWEADPDNWPNPTCDDPGCIALTRAAIEGET